MQVIFFSPKITQMDKNDKARKFYEECKNIFDNYITNIVYIPNGNKLNQMIGQKPDQNDIIVFFNSIDGNYDTKFIGLLNMYYEAKCRIWPIAMEKNSECRMPPKPVSECQSFDYAVRCENRSPLMDNHKAIAQLFARKIIAKTLSPLYQDEVLYFISHKRSDGEDLAAKLSDQLKLLTRERNIFRDIVRVEVGDNAQEQIDKNLPISDVVIFLQTEEAQDSSWIIKELSYAIVNDIPVLWIQIDNASYERLEFRPGDGPILRYNSKEFECKESLIKIADEIEEKCFELIMNSSNQAYSYVEYLNEMDEVKLTGDKDAVLAYTVEYHEETKDRHETGDKVDYIQCFGRNPKMKDIELLQQRVLGGKAIEHGNPRIFLLSNHGKYDLQLHHEGVLEENYEDYIMNLENILGRHREKKDKRIIISGSFPDGDKVYQISLTEAVLIYAREIIKNGYTLVFGAHPTFQNLIFKIGELYAEDIFYSIEMHMSREYEKFNDMEKIKKTCTLILSDNLEQMRERMICENKAEALICLGGKIKEDKSQQGVDQEIELARKAGIPVALVGTVGGRSSEYANEILHSERWFELNSWSKDLNEKLFYNMTHRVMISRLLKAIEENNQD